MSAMDIIRGSMRAVNILSAGRVPTSAEAQDYLEILNQMLDAFNAERLMIYTVNRYGPFPLTIGQQVYTLGTGGDFNIPRPPRVEFITIINLTNNVQPDEIPIEMLDEEGWASIPVKNIGGPLPEKVWEDGDFPLRNLSYWTIPTVPVQTCIYGWGALQQFPDLNTKLIWPPGYLEALRWNLAIRLDNAEISPYVAAMAVESKARLKGFNQPTITLECNDGIEMLSGDSAGAYNFLSDQPVYRGRT